ARPLEDSHRVRSRGRQVHRRGQVVGTAQAARRQGDPGCAHRRGSHRGEARWRHLRAPLQVQRLSEELPRYVKAMELSKLAPGTMAGVEVEGRTILLSNLGGEVYAVDGTCTHEESKLSQGFMIEERVVCQLHLSQFDL